MRKNNTELFEAIFENQNIAETRKSTISIRHREFNIIHRAEEDEIYLTSSSTFAGKVKIYQRKIIKIIRH